MEKDNSIQIIFDGGCPFCRKYVEFLRLTVLAEVELIDARTDQTRLAVEEVSLKEVDQDMVILINGVSYHGWEALNVLTMLSTRVTVLNKLNFFIFRKKCIARLVYPVLRVCRFVVLKVLRRKRLV